MIAQESSEMQAMLEWQKLRKNRHYHKLKRINWRQYRRPRQCAAIARMSMRSVEYYYKSGGSAGCANYGAGSHRVKRSAAFAVWGMKSRLRLQVSKIARLIECYTPLTWFERPPAIPAAWRCCISIYALCGENRGIVSIAALCRALRDAKCELDGEGQLATHVITLWPAHRQEEARRCPLKNRRNFGIKKYQRP